MTATAIPRQGNRDSMTVGDGLGLLHDAGFVIAGLQAEYTHNDWLVHVERDGAFVPFDTLTAVTHALTFATLIADGQIDLVVIA